MPRACRFAVIAALAAVPATAQDLPRIEVGAGYQVQQMASLFLEKGWFADVAVNVTPRIAVVAEAAGAYDSSDESFESLAIRFEASRSLRVHSGSAGVRVNFRPDARLVVYLQALGGAARSRTEVSFDVTQTMLPTIPGIPVFTPSVLFPDVATATTRTHASLRVGGGVTMALTDAFGLRVALDYGGLLGDRSPPGGPRLMGGLAFGF